jgi:hypothetical protein
MSARRSLDDIVAYLGTFPTGAKASQIAQHFGVRRETIAVHLRRLRFERRIISVGAGRSARWSSLERAHATIAWFKANQRKRYDGPSRPRPSALEPKQTTVNAATAPPLRPRGPAWVFSLGSMGD